jgi:o-succinylbenzoate synthase
LGNCGLGDCAPLPEAGTEDLDSASIWLSGFLPTLTGLTADAALAALPAPGDCPPAARCGLETSLLDLSARQAGLPLSRYLEPRAASEVAVNASLGALDSGSSDRLPGLAGYSVVKLKVGIRPVVDELAELYRLATVLPTTTRLRLDANRAWSLDAARRFIEGLAGLPVESLEEPLAHPTLPLLSELQRRAAFPIAVDESITHLDIASLLRQASVRRLVLKPMVLGGLLPALALSRQALDAGLKALITTTVDSAVGCWAAVHLAAALDQDRPGPCHGLATSDWLLQDVAPPPIIDQGIIHIGEQSGLAIPCPRSDSRRNR